MREERRVGTSREERARAGCVIEVRVRDDDPAYLLGLFALRFELIVIGQAVKDFLLCFIAYGAGVVEDQPGFFHRLDLAIALGYQRAHDLF